MITTQIRPSFVDVINNVWNLDLSRCFLASGSDDRNDKMSNIQGLIEKYKSTCTVPKHPKACPECGQKVGVYHLNYSEAVFMCSNEECVWPLVTHDPEEILGKSDVATLVKIQVEREAQNESCLSDDEDDNLYQEKTTKVISDTALESPKSPLNSDVGNPENKAISEENVKTTEEITEDKKDESDQEFLSDHEPEQNDESNQNDTQHEETPQENQNSSLEENPTENPDTSFEEQEETSSKETKENQDSSFEDTLAMPPQLLSPIAPSPATPMMPDKTPIGNVELLSI